MISLNEGQAFIKSEALKWIKHPYQQVFQYSGNAGTGKSVVLSEIIKSSGIPFHKILSIAYTGNAACVMRQNGIYNARTIHSGLYRAVVKQGKVMDTYFNIPEENIVFEKRDLSGIELIVIDEGRMVPFNMKADIEEQGIPVLVCGDKNQLPPIYGEPAYLRDDDIYYILTEPMRQKEKCGILYIADLIRMGKDIPAGTYGNAMVIESSELTNEMIKDSNIIICGKNKTKDDFNKRVREEILGIDNISLPQYGERMICRKNNSLLEVDGITLCNGLIGTVMSHNNMETFDTKSFGMDFLPDMLYYPFENLRVDYEYLTAPSELRDKLKFNKFNRAEKFLFAYSCTTHSTQGASIPKGIYVQENLGSDIQMNLDYTGVTRFKDQLIFVKRKKLWY